MSIMSNPNAFVISNLGFQYSPDSPPVLKGISLTIQHGERVAVLGYSGHGKTTLLNILGSLDRSVSPTGSAQYFSRAGVEYDLLGVSREQRQKLLQREFGFVFQDTHLLPYLDATNNVAARMIYADAPVQESKSRADATLSALDLDPELLSRKPRQVSGGQRQRISFARAVAHSPEVVFADEPTANLDPTTAQKNLHLLSNYLKQTGATLLMVTHNFEEALATCNRILLIQDGSIIADLQNDPDHPRSAGELVERLRPKTVEVPEHTPTSPIANSPAEPSREPVARHLWFLWSVLRDLRDVRTRSFAAVTVLVMLLATLTLASLMGLKEGTIDTLRNAVTQNPNYRRIEVSPDLDRSHFVTSAEVQQIRSVPGVVRAETFDLRKVPLSGTGVYPTFMVLKATDQTWESISPAKDLPNRFGMVLSEELAQRLKVISGSLPKDYVPWKELSGKKNVVVRTSQSPVSIPILGVSRILSHRFHRDGIMTCSTQWYYQHWKPSFAFHLTTPNGEPLARPSVLVQRQNFRLKSNDLRPWNDLKGDPQIRRLSGLIRGWYPTLVVRADQASSRNAELTLSWKQHLPGGAWKDGALLQVDHEAYVKALVQTLKKMQMEVVPSETQTIAQEETTLPKVPQAFQEEQSGHVSVIINDFWQLPEILASIRNLGMTARSSVEPSVALLKAADTVLRFAVLAALVVLLVLGVVSVGSAAFTLVERSRGEIGIHLASGVSRLRILGHYLGLGLVLTAFSVGPGLLLAYLLGELSGTTLTNVGQGIGVELRFHLSGLNAVLLAALQIVVCLVSILIPCLITMVRPPAQLLRQRIS